MNTKGIGHNMNKDKKSIGVFDSGFGGINVLRGIVREMPEYDFVYLGDTARAPYGARSQDVIYEFSKQATDFLFRNDCELVVFACNTASSEALRKIQQEYLPELYPKKKVLGVLIPGAEEAVERSKNGKIGVIATEGTVKSGAFIREIKKIFPQAEIYQNACPLLVPLIEEGEHDSPAADFLLKKYLDPLIEEGIDTLILGCTHYGILEDKIRGLVGDEIEIISSEKVVPKKLIDYLSRDGEIDSRLSRNGVTEFYTTDLTEKFESLGSGFFGSKIKANKIFLD